MVTEATVGCGGVVGWPSTSMGSGDNGGESDEALHVGEPLWGAVVPSKHTYL
jgi:hypothetical protein